MPSNYSFLSGSNIVVYGVSPKRKTIASEITKQLRIAGYKVYQIHPDGGDEYFTDLKSLPEAAEAAYVATNPKNASIIIKQVIAAGFKRIWLQWGSYNKELVNECKQAGLQVHTGCLLMYIPNAGFMHSFHRFLYELFKGRQ